MSTEDKSHSIKDLIDYSKLQYIHIKPSVQNLENQVQKKIFSEICQPMMKYTKWARFFQDIGQVIPQHTVLI